MVGPTVEQAGRCAAAYYVHSALGSDARKRMVHYGYVYPPGSTIMEQSDSVLDNQSKRQARIALVARTRWDHS